MHRNTLLVTLFAVLIVLATASLAGPDTKSEKFQTAATLQLIVDNLLKGKEIGDLVKTIDAEAYLVDNANYENLPGVLKGESTQCHLVEGKDSKVLFQSLMINDEENAAFLVLKSKSQSLGERNHSVVFFKTASKDWQVKSWHISK
jgi:hypothetical protein